MNSQFTSRTSIFSAPIQFLAALAILTAFLTMTQEPGAAQTSAANHARQSG